MRQGLSIAAGAIVAAALFAGVFAWRNGDRLQPSGNVLKLRTVSADTQRTLAVVDLRIVNGSNTALQVRQVDLYLETENGSKLEGALVSGVDTRQLFGFYPALGEAYNPPLIAGVTVAAHRTQDFMLAARLDRPEPEIQQSRDLIVTVQDRSGISFELHRKAK